MTELLSLLFPPTISQAFEYLLIGAVHFPVIAFSSCLISSLAAPNLPNIVESLISLLLFVVKKDSSSSVTSAASYTYLRFIVGIFIILFCLVIILFLLKIRKRTSRKTIIGETTSTIKSFFGLGKGLQQLPGTREISFLLWQFMFSLSLSVIFIVIDHIQVFPEHVMVSSMNPEILGSIMPEQLFTVMNFVRPLLFICISLFWLMLLGWWSNPKEFHEIPDVS